MKGTGSSFSTMNNVSFHPPIMYVDSEIPLKSFSDETEEEGGLAGIRYRHHFTRSSSGLHHFLMEQPPLGL